MGCECYQIGGPFIAEDPNCEIHRQGGLQEQVDELQEKNRRLRDLLRRIYETPNLNLGNDDLVCELDAAVYRDS